jgi:hypothetical protein
MPRTPNPSASRRRLVRLLCITLAAGLALPIAPGSAAEGSASLAPEVAGNTAVRAGQFMTVSGAAPEGPVTEAVLVAEERGGGEVRQPYGATVLERPAGSTQFLRSDDGRLSGRLGLNCVFDDPSNFCPVAHGEVVAVRLELVAGGVALRTAPLRVDYTRPFISEYRVLEPQVVEARFNEPVRGADDALAPLDWSLDDPRSVVVGVRMVQGDCGYVPVSDGRAQRSGCTRRLDLLTPLPEDSRPLVSYSPALNRPLVVDDAGNAASRDSRETLNTSRALDLVRPAVPRVEAVDGRTPTGAVSGRDSTPTVRVSNLTAGHRVRIEATPLSGGTTVQGAEILAEGSTAELPSPLLPADGAYSLRAVAVDPSDNASGQAEKRPARADGSPNPVSYLLDTVAPLLVSAAVDSGKVRVRFSEPVSGPDSTDDWKVRGPDGTARRVTAVEGSGDSRLLTVEGGAPPGGRLDYAPPGARYTDAAGNQVEDVERLIGGLPVPVVTSPSGPLVTREPVVRLAGTARPGSGVEVLRGAAPLPDIPVAPVAADGRWSVEVPVQQNARNDDLSVRSVQAGEPASPVAALPAITHDSVGPAVAVTRPTGSENLTAGSRSVAGWSTSDANPGSIRVEISTDEGATWQERGTVEARNGDGQLSFVVPQANTATARVRVVAVDQAANATTALSRPFAIDGVAPSFTARTTALREVTVTFSELVSGPVGAWTIDGRPAVLRRVDGAATPVPPQSVDRARVLVFETATDFGQDGTPEVVYSPSPTSDATGQLRDQSTPGNTLADRVETAVDGIRPAAPRIDSVQGRSAGSGRVLGGSPTPTVSVSGVTSGHRLVVERLGTDGAVLATGTEVVAGGSTALLTSPRLPDDGEHRLRVVAVDRADNRSTETAKNGPGADGVPNAVTYVLDSSVPAVRFAFVVDDDFVEVRFTEPVTGPDNPADWRVVDSAGRPVPFGEGVVTVVRVTGSGDRRTLQAAGAREGSLLVYSPAGDRYGDASGNTVGDATVPLLALAPPVVTTPPRAVFLRETSTTVGGTAEPGTTVLVHRRGAGGEPAGAPLATAQTTSDGAWSAVVPLRTDEANELLVRSRRGDGRLSVLVPVPTLHQDAVAPVLSAQNLPGQGTVLQGGSLFTFEWTVSDRNLSERPILLEHSADGGSTWERLELEPVESANDPSATNRRSVRLPSTGTDRAVVRIVATDLAGNTSTVQSKPFIQTGVRDVRRFACPPDRVQPAGFTDTGSSTFRFEIDCLAAYGFTRGVTTDRYVPLGDVTRAQMAVFVSRLARYGGLALDTRDRGFTDLRSSPQETRDAVNALAALGVVEGVGGGRYDPAGKVTRAQMASFLVRLQAALGTRFPTARDAFDDDARDVHEDNINALAQAGVVQGTAFRTYQPRASISRQQMAGFLVRYVDGRIEAGEMRSRF